MNTGKWIRKLYFLKLQYNETWIESSNHCVKENVGAGTRVFSNAVQVEIGVWKKKECKTKEEAEENTFQKQNTNSF